MIRLHNTLGILKFEPIVNDDLDKIRHLQPPDWTDIVSNFRFYTSSSFCNPVKVTHNNQVVGTGVSVSFMNTAWLAHIIVDPAMRNQGIGGAIVDHLLNELDAQSVDTVLLIATKIGEPVYRKKGFCEVCEYVFLQRTNRFIEHPVSPCIQPFSPTYFSDVMGLDIYISGEDRRSLISKYLTNASLYLEHDHLTGFYLPDLGEGMVIAETKQAGIELMKVRYARSDKAAVPSVNTTGIAFLKENGFVETSKAWRMVRGPSILWYPGKIFSRIGGNLG